MNLNGKNIVITGAGSGIGKALTERLIELNVTVIAADLDVKNIRVHEKITAVACDVSRPEEIDRLFDTAAHSGGIDVFIANAGFCYYEVIDNPDWHHISSIFATNVFAPIYICEKMRALNDDRRPYRVVMTASAMAFLSMPGYAIYSATKAAVSGFADGYRFEPGQQDTLTVVYPIATRTNFFRMAADGIDIPIPFPTQSADQVARAVIDGIRRDRKRVYPSLIFTFTVFFNRFLPFILPIYTAIEKRRLHRWYAEKKKRDLNA